MKRHAQLIKLGLNTNPIFATRLINDYLRSPLSNSVRHAHQLFDEVPNKDTVLWTSLISAYTHSNLPYKALQLFSAMLQQPESTNTPNHFVFATVARAIASCPEQIVLGQCIQAHVIKSGFLPGNVILETSFVDMYVKCHVVECARKVFDEMPSRNLVTWNAMVSGYVQNYMEVQGLNLFCTMKCREFLVPDEFSVATVLTGCAWIQDLVMGMQVHGYVIVGGLESKCMNSIGNMYFCCGEVCSAESVLSGIESDIVSKLIMIRGYASNSRYLDALNYISLEGNIAEILNKDYSIVVPLLNACANLSLTKVGKQVHTFIITSGKAHPDSYLSEDNAIIASTLIDMYCKCRSVYEASKFFKNWYYTREISPWNSIISGYIYNGYIEDARTLMESIPEKNVITWTTMISGYVLIGRPQEGLALLNKMYSVEEKIRVDGNCMTFVVGLEACSQLTDLGRGKQIHAKIIRILDNADTSNVIVGTALVDMYSKSGYMHYAQIVFDMMLDKNVVAWTSIIMGNAVNGLGLRGLETFKQMISTGIQPNEVTFVSVLTACSYCGLVDEGLYYFKLMREKYKLVAREDHYTCLIDMLGRVGRLEDAWNFLKEIDDKHNGSFSVGTVWDALLGACQLHGNVELGILVGKKLLEDKKQGLTTYKTLSNVYAAAQMWNEVHSIRESWRNKGDAALEPGLSRIYANTRGP
ncbi:Pentatricopeptide repeat-containing protein [Heracleum sosnowskyi]|uniref:Pentatricopeptide repeat-containing protein n=1 Tax=Heracleum sosnowskyi TaxID=360622 RepID=A0AAD8GNJ9_9APIA|nr:Pentatricopeptide repeat-containing protein [Heracleum sosnowskyi]